MQSLIAALHLLGMAMGLYGVLARSAALRAVPTVASLKQAFRADSIWGISALILIGTGLFRLLQAIDKPTVYYMKNPLFHAKLTLIVVILALEIGPMMMLLRARMALKNGQAPETIVPAAAVKRIGMFSHIQALALVIIVFLAAALARGIGARG